MAATPVAQHSQHPPAAAVDFGILPLKPIGDLPCFQSGVGPLAIGGPFDPCSYKLHVLTPGEVTIAKGGQVTFQIHGGGHGFAIYEVSNDTTAQYRPVPVRRTDPPTSPTRTCICATCGGQRQRETHREDAKATSCSWRRPT